MSSDYYIDQNCSVCGQKPSRYFFDNKYFCSKCPDVKETLKSFKTIIENFNPGYTVNNNQERLSWDEYFMTISYLVANRSKDCRTKIGTVLVKDNNIISTGYNNFPRMVKDLPERYEDRETKYKFVSHSESNSITTAARLGISTLGSTCYTFGIPCSECAKTLIQGGVSEIVLHQNWPDMTHSIWLESVKISKIMFEEAGVKIRWLDKVLGVKGYLDGKVIEV